MEYTVSYNTLRRRLNTMKILISSNDQIDSNIRNIKLAQIDRLLKDLDSRYEDNHSLSGIEAEVDTLVSKI